MIDLHCHTRESDGTDTPHELVQIAADAGITTLSITDHDTFAGYDAARPHAWKAGIELICGVELSCRHEEKTVHLLGYFRGAEGAPAEFREWVDGILTSRTERNLRLIAKLNGMGLDITLEEVQAIGGSVTGRPHFANVLVAKGYAADRNDAFRRLIGEEGAAFVERIGPTLAEAAGRIRAAGGVSSLAHPVRIGYFREPERELALLAELREAGLTAVEVYHSDHTPALCERYLEFANLLGLLQTGGSDYHGGNKAGLELGSVPVPWSVMEGLRSLGF
ncbi:phosphatase [Bryobacterales bacterium F-183]|nr:phosphatase [Bryobacterales bacterium F-183]